MSKQASILSTAKTKTARKAAARKRTFRHQGKAKKTTKVTKTTIRRKEAKKSFWKRLLGL
ncbi:MAG: hypothetical protein ABSA92_00760 [Candidatus Bathyarchaeia archaeon]|jgi:hypothetical protein